MSGRQRKHRWHLLAVVLSAMALFALNVGPVLAHGSTSTSTTSDSSETRQRNVELHDRDSAGDPGYANADTPDDWDEPDIYPDRSTDDSSDGERRESETDPDDTNTDTSDDWAEPDGGRYDPAHGELDATGDPQPLSPLPDLGFTFGPVAGAGLPAAGASARRRVGADRESSSYATRHSEHRGPRRDRGVGPRLRRSDSRQ